MTWRGKTAGCLQETSFSCSGRLSTVVRFSADVSDARYQRVFAGGRAFPEIGEKLPRIFGVGGIERCALPGPLSIWTSTDFRGVPSLSVKPRTRYNPAFFLTLAIPDFTCSE